jgi:acyl dehydratase
MHRYALGQELPSYSVLGYNYAEEHDNKIHSDVVASRYGFKGGLVPGVGVYAYLTHPIVATFGREWLERGAMTARFLKPLYHGEEARVLTVVTQLDPLTLNAKMTNPDGILCAVGEASLHPAQSSLNQVDYPHQELPAPDQRPTATIAQLPSGKILGSLDWRCDLAALTEKFLPDVRATLPLYFGADAVCHPAYYLAQANEILMANVELGPWIHTGSEVQHYALPHQGDSLSLRGKVTASYEKRGHEMVTLDLGLFAQKAKPMAHLRHTAIVRLRES